MVYEGERPYVFISYSHKDNAAVLPIIDSLQKRGVRIWYDSGIEPGAEWPEYIAERLDGCSVFIAFISKEANDSPNCRQEIHRAIHMRKDILIAYLEDFQLSPGMEMRLGPLQAVKRRNFDSDSAFAEAIGNARLLRKCAEAESSEIASNAEGRGESSATERAIANGTSRASGSGSIPDQSRPNEITFNSSLKGSSFLRAKALREKTYRSGPIEIGQESSFFVLATVKNDCEDASMSAENVRIAMQVRQIDECTVDVLSELRCSNANPQTYSSCIRFVSGSPFSLVYQQGNAFMYSMAKGLHSDYRMRVSDNIMSSGGALLGFTQTDGKIPGGPDNAVTVSIYLAVVRPQS